jgi:hypothetical protein
VEWNIGFVFGFLAPGPQEIGTSRNERGTQRKGKRGKGREEKEEEEERKTK